MLPRAAELEERVGDVLAVVGVHSGKYPAERRTDNIRAACARLGVTHPVVNDRQFRVWRDYAVSAWPTIALVGPDGYLLAEQAGELPIDVLASYVAQIAAEYEAAGTLDRGPLDLGRDPYALAEPSGALRFPTRLALAGDTLYVSDSGHDRVLELRLDAAGSHAEVTRAWGGRQGFADGGPGDAAFREPQGLAHADGELFVADRKNHAIRRIDLGGGAVTTIAGTGALGAWGATGEGARSTPLRSPFDVLVRGRQLVIAMAGSHQLWGLDLNDGALEVVAGSGGEEIMDGPARAALLAQPMGLAGNGERTYFADSESSAIRTLTSGPAPEVATILGTGLFDHGDKDGAGGEVRLQHAQALAWHGGALAVADTYNDKIKRVDPAARTSAAWPGEAGSGEALWEPSGIVSGAGRLIVADTNHHRLVHVAEDGSLSEIEIV